jgi:hypothetical protein
MTYAAGTSISVEKSKAELEKVVRQHGAYNYGSATLDAEGKALVYFSVGKAEQLRQVRLILPLPKVTDFKKSWSGRKQKTPEQRWEQACRERWRLLVLVVRAKLELIAVGGSSLEREFLADIALPDGRTVAEVLLGPLALAYKTGKVPPMLGGPAPRAPDATEEPRE